MTASASAETDVLIIGAGPAGLVLALWLTHWGVRVRIIDKTAEPGTTSREMTNTATTAAETLSVVIEREIPHPPEKLWRALTQPHLIEEWLMKNDFKPVVGHRFNLRGDWGGVLDCKVLAVEPNRTLSYTWDFAHDDAAYNLKSVVTFSLTPTRTGPICAWSSSGFRPDQKQAFGGAKAGWQQFFVKLEQVLSRTE